MIFALGMGLYHLTTFMALLLGWPYLLLMMAFGHRQKWRQRLGWLPPQEGRPVWIHGASVGEMGVIAPFFAQLRSLLPGKDIVLSTMTATGQKRAGELFPGTAGIFFLPLDFWFAQNLALNRTKPGALVLTETELWPNLIRQCRKKKIPVFLVNARLSARSFKQYHVWRFLFGPLLNTIQLIACQSREDAERYLALGVRPEIVTVTGNLKYDGIKGPVSNAEKQGLRKDLGLKPGDLVFTAGSTREGEETIILEAWQEIQRQKSEGKNQKVKLIMAPRHPGRFSEVEKLLASRSLNYARRSGQKNGVASDNYDILLLDTIGELISAYAAADLAFVGGSLVPVGGHNPLEPAALGLPVIFGPHMFNARESAEGLLACGGAVQAKDAGELNQALAGFLGSGEKRTSTGAKARAFVDSKRGVSNATAELVVNNIKEIM